MAISFFAGRSRTALVGILGGEPGVVGETCLNDEGAIDTRLFETLHPGDILTLGTRGG